MKVVETKGSEFARHVVSTLKREIESNGDDSDVEISVLYKPRGNIAGVLLYDCVNEVVVYVIVAGDKPGHFLVWTALAGETRSLLNEANNLSFVFIEGAKVYEYEAKELLVAIEDIRALFREEKRNVERHFEVIHGRDQYYPV
jgi:hypothetical protein